jgi:hypothetical protein
MDFVSLDTSIGALIPARGGLFAVRRHPNSLVRKAGADQAPSRPRLRGHVGTERFGLPSESVHERSTTGKSLRRIVVATAALVVLLAMSAVALADSPHFIRASGNLDNDGNLTVSFKDAGLGTNQLITTR